MKNNLIIHSFIGLAAVLAASHLSAQTRTDNTQDATASAPACNVTFTNDISGSYCGDTDMKNVGKGLGGISSYDFTDSFGYTINAVPNVEIDIGTTYHGSFFNIGHEAAAPMVKRLQSISAEASAKWMIDEKWIAIGSIGNGWYNSGTQFNAHGINISGGVGVIRNFNENLSVMLGVGFNSLAKNDLKILPGLGIQYVYSPSWTFSLGFPKTAVTWTACKNFQLSLVVEGESQTYYVRAKDLTKDLNAGRPVGGRMEYEDIRTGLRADYEMTENISVSATAGYLFSRKFDFYESDYKLRSDGGAVYGSIGLTAKF